MFNITITNTETGEIEFAKDCVAIIGAVGIEDSATEMVLTNCNGLQLFGTICSAKKAIGKAISSLADD